MVIKKYVDIDGLCEHTTLSKTSIYKLMKEEEANFPRPYVFKYINKRVFWLLTEVDDWFTSNTTKQEIAA